jgi:CubicO group peptidase (beta-lactamase class C family)
MQLAMTDVSGQAFPDLMRALVLAPAGMTRSTFAQPLAETDRANAATAHGERGSAVPRHSHAYPEMAAAGLWTTPSDLLRLGLAVVAAARAEPNAILGPESTVEMLTIQAGSFGLGFNLEDGGDGKVFSHNGSNHGFNSLFFTYVDGRGGAAIMINGQNGVLVGEVAACLLASSAGNTALGSGRRADANAGRIRPNGRPRVQFFGFRVSLGVRQSRYPLPPSLLVILQFWGLTS